MKSFIDKLHERFVTTSIHNTKKEVDVGKWLTFLESLPKSNSNVEKSYNKFLCRMYYFPAWKRRVMNFCGFFADFVVAFYVLFSYKTIADKRNGVLVLERSRDVPDFSDIVPRELYKKYREVIVVDNYNKKFGLLCKETRRFWVDAVKRYPFQFFFHYWVYMELAAHTHFLLKYNPETVAVYVNERNIVSPILTELYETHGRKLISFMHGEYLLQLVQAHMKFSEYYVWDESYVKMFRDILRCDADFICYKPGKFEKRWHLEVYNPSYLCTYYFSDPTEKSIYNVAEIFKEFISKGKKCKVRMHPRSTVNTKLIKQVFSKAGVEVEDSNTVSLEKSLGETQYAVGMETTVLFEALAEGRNIVLDDVSDVSSFKNLQDRWFRLLQVDHILLSELIKET